MMPLLAAFSTGVTLVLSTCIYGSTTIVDHGRFFSFLIHTQSVELLGWGISPSLPTQRTTQTRTDIRALSRIRTHDPSVRASEDGSSLRRRGHSERLTSFT
jgi:hypothetical protein